MIKHVIFDFDGTIADTVGFIPEVINEVLVHFNKPLLTEEEICCLTSLRIRKAAKKCGIKWRELPKYALTAQKIMHGKLDRVELIANIKDVLESLAADYTTNIISLNSKDNIKKVITRHDINTIDNIFSTRGKLTKKKILKKYLKMYGVKEHEVIYVGDELGDILACRKNNIKVIAVTWGFDSRETLSAAKPDHIVDSPYDIPAIAAAY
ncbi:MAG: HAD-IA family hydrolase [Clostridia bacterium]|nr:HAD-IA family hydrolase [Clostridia bacterium]